MSASSSKISAVLALDQDIQLSINNASNKNRMAVVTFFTKSCDRAEKIDHPFVMGPVDVDILSRVIDDDGNCLSIVYGDSDECGLAILDSKLKVVCVILNYASRMKAVQAYIGTYFGVDEKEQRPRDDDAHMSTPVAEVAVQKKESVVLTNPNFEKDDPKTYMSLDIFIALLQGIDENYMINVDANCSSNARLQFCMEDGLGRCQMMESAIYSNSTNCVKLIIGSSKVGHLVSYLRHIQRDFGIDQKIALCLNSKNIISIKVDDGHASVETNDLLFKDTHFLDYFDSQPIVNYIAKMNQVAKEHSPHGTPLNSNIIALLIEAITREFKRGIHLQFYLTKDGKLYTLSQIVSNVLTSPATSVESIQRICMTHESIFRATCSGFAKSVCVIELDIDHDAPWASFEPAISDAYDNEHFDVVSAEF